MRTFSELFHPLLHRPDRHALCKDVDRYASKRFKVEILWI